MKAKKSQPAELLNWEDAWRVYHLDDVVIGDIVTPVGLHGAMQTVRKVGAGDPLCRGKLFVVKHDAPGSHDKAPVSDNIGVVLPAMVMVKNIDTRGCTENADVYLSATPGKATFDAPDDCEPRIVGRVLRVGPPIMSDESDARSGAVGFYL